MSNKCGKTSFLGRRRKRVLKGAWSQAGLSHTRTHTHTQTGLVTFTSLHSQTLSLSLWLFHLSWNALIRSFFWQEAPCVLPACATFLRKARDKQNNKGRKKRWRSRNGTLLVQCLGAQAASNSAQTLEFNKFKVLFFWALFCYSPLAGINWFVHKWASVPSC